MLHYSMHKRIRLVPVPSTVNSVHDPRLISWISLLILSFHPHLRLTRCFFTLCSPTKSLYAPFPSSTFNMPRLSHFSLHRPGNIKWGEPIIMLHNQQFPPISRYLVPLSPCNLSSNTLSYIPPSMWQTKFNTHVIKPNKSTFIFHPNHKSCSQWRTVSVNTQVLFFEIGPPFFWSALSYSQPAHIAQCDYDTHSFTARWHAPRLA